MKKLLMVALIATTITGSAQAILFGGSSTSIARPNTRLLNRFEKLERELKRAESKHLNKAARHLKKAIGHLKAELES